MKVIEFLISEVDKDNNGNISEDEFIDFFGHVENLNMFKAVADSKSNKGGVYRLFMLMYFCMCFITFCIFVIIYIKQDPDKDDGNTFVGVGIIVTSIFIGLGLLAVILSIVRMKCTAQQNVRGEMVAAQFTLGTKIYAQYKSFMDSDAMWKIKTLLGWKRPQPDILSDTMDPRASDEALKIDFSKLGGLHGTAYNNATRVVTPPRVEPKPIQDQKYVSYRTKFRQDDYSEDTESEDAFGNTAYRTTMGDATQTQMTITQGYDPSMYEQAKQRQAIAPINCNYTTFICRI